MKTKHEPHNQATAGRPPSGSAFSRSLLSAIRAEAKRNHYATSVRHVYPRAYCVAKPAEWCAVFAVPPCDSESNAIRESVTVQNRSAECAEPGKWYSLAYCVHDVGNAHQRVIFELNTQDQQPGGATEESQP